jgi:hypothetical protein
MAFIGKAEFARLAGVNRTLVYRMIKEKKLTVRPDGKLDTEDQTNKNYINKQERPDGTKTTDKKTVKPKSKSKPNNKKEIFTNRIINNPSRDDESDDEEPEDEGQLKIYKGMDLSRLSKHDLERYHKMVSIEEKEIKNAEKLKEVVSTEAVTKVFHKLYQIDVNIFLQMSHTLSSKIAQKIFKSNDAEKITLVAKAINEETYKTQNYIQRELNSFLEQIEKEPVSVES